MADAASEEDELMDTAEQKKNNNNTGLEDRESWGSSAPLTLCEEEQLMRTLTRMDRSGSTESVVTTSGVESCSSSPSRPVTPMPPLPTHHHPYDECLRGADSDDSGLGPSPAKSAIRPNSPASPIQFGSRCSDDSLLDLSPRTDNSYESEDNPKTDDAFFDEDDDDEEGDENDAPVPKSPGSFKFLLSSSSNSQRTDQDLQFQSSLLEDPFRCGTTTTTTPQQTKFPSPLLTPTTVATFRCGQTTNVDHTFRHCSPPTSKQDTLASFFDEQARHQEDSKKLNAHFLKNHLNQQQQSSSDMSPNNLTDKLTDRLLKTHLIQKQQSSDEVPVNNQTDKLNDHFLKNHLNQQQPSSDDVSINSLTNKLSDVFLKNHLNQQQQSNEQVSSNNLTDKLNDHFLKNHLNQQQQSSGNVSTKNLTDKLNDHFLKNHPNHQQQNSGDMPPSNLTDELNDCLLKNHLTQPQPSSDEVSPNNLTDKLNDHFLKNHLNQQQPNSSEVSSNNNINDHFLKNHLNQQQQNSDEGSSKTLTDKLNDHPFLQNHHLNPKVVLIRSNFGGPSGYAEESSSNSSRTGSSDCTSSNCSQAGVDTQGGSSSTSAVVDDGACKWLDCDRSADANTTATDLVDHIRQCHVREQSDEGKSFVCLWVGCKVYDRPSCSRSWLERHVLLHGGSKPFRCIVDGCHQRFGSEAVLERHVNSHFPQRTKLTSHCRRKHSKHKHTKRPTSNKSKDFFDDAAMEHVRHNLLLLSSVDGINSGGPPSAITFHSNVIARRMDNSGKVHLLLHWDPEDMLPDSWIPETEMLSNLEKTIPVSRLPPRALQLPSMAALSKTGVAPRPGKRKRK